jgi:hypothetical protein
MKHVKPHKLKSWIVVRDDPASIQEHILLDGNIARCRSENAILDGYYDDIEEAKKVAEEWSKQYPTMEVWICCNDETLFDPPPDWEAIIAESKQDFEKLLVCTATHGAAYDEWLRQQGKDHHHTQDKDFKEWRAEREREWADQRPLGEWDAGGEGVYDLFGDSYELDLPPPRGWLLGNIFCRTFLSCLLGGGGTGKTALRYAQLMSLAIGRSLTGDHVFQRCRVLIVSLEDDDKELRRRIAALRIHYKIDRAELRGWLFLAAPGKKAGKLVVEKRGELKIGSFGGKLEAVIEARDIDIVSIDPFIKSHAVDENDNNAIDIVAQLLSDLAFKYDIAVDTPHHVSKAPPEAGNASRGRGASAMKDAARLVYTLTTMTPDEAKAFGIKEEDRRDYARMDSAKVNIVRHLRGGRWYRLVSVPLNNATDLYPNGDEVQTVEQWFPPDAWKGMDDAVMDRILAEIDAGLPDGTRYTDANNAKERAAWKVVQKHIPDKSPQQAREVIKEWIANGVLTRTKYQHPTTYKQVDGLWRGKKHAPPQDEELPF